MFNYDFALGQNSNFKKYLYSVDLNNIQNDEAKVTLKVAGLKEDKILFKFPKTIPGVYKNINYGAMICSIQAYDEENNRLKINKIDKNSFMIFNSKRLKVLEYWVSDTWDHPKAKNGIWAVVGTNIEKESNYVLNPPGWFGYFENYKNIPLILKINYPTGLKPFTALPFSENIGDKSIFLAENYHHLIDSPIMISKADTATFYTGKAKVSIALYHDNDRVDLLKSIKSKIKSSLEAVNTFWGDLILNDYYFIIYIRSGEIFAKILNSNETSLLKKIKTFLEHKNLLFSGALEHKKSSFYVLSDFGDLSFLNLINRITIHELLHLITPISLHSSSINNFDYNKLNISKHLWLYEGVIEYFTMLTLLKSGLISQKSFLLQIKDKIRENRKFPYKRISFTELSENIYQKRYNKYYYQVYERGALIAFLLDIEIIYLTNGKKTLKDIIYELFNEYNDEDTFSEADLFDEITNLVHPSLRTWFSKYIESNSKLKIEKSFDLIGLAYNEKGIDELPLDIVSDLGVRLNYFSLDHNYTIKKIKNKKSNSFEVGDVINTEYLKNILYSDSGYPIQEGSQIMVNIIRNQKQLSLPYSVKYSEQKYIDMLRINKTPTESQKYYYGVWSAF
ncbi:MAG: hypothetical protein ACJZ14_04790 [Candidatus Neomarinimicrobiota bacterium]